MADDFGQNGSAPLTYAMLQEARKKMEEWTPPDDLFGIPIITNPFIPEGTVVLMQHGAVQDVVDVLNQNQELRVENARLERALALVRQLIMDQTYTEAAEEAERALGVKL